MASCISLGSVDRLIFGFVFGLMFGWLDALGFALRPLYSKESSAAPCSQLHFLQLLEPSLTAVEKRFVCGDPEGPAIDAPWAVIPLSQAQYHLRNFLQERGYHHPRFELNEGRTELRVDLGEKTRVTGVEVVGGLGLVDPHRKRRVLGQPLTPDLLNQLEQWVEQNLKKLGYPCPDLRAEGDPETGKVWVWVKPGPMQFFQDVMQEPIPGVRDQILRRYDAFSPGDLFNGDLLSVTEDRVAASGLVESSRLTPQCGSGMRQAIVPGAPRLVIGKFGLNTEGLVLGSFLWKSTRVGKGGSSLEFSFDGSARKQSLVSSMNWYFLDQVSRSFLVPKVSLIHRTEVQFETVDTSAQLGWSATQEVGQVGWVYFLGPVWSFYETLQGLGAPLTQFASVAGRAQVKSHDFEFYARNPRSGYQAIFAGELSHQGFFSNLTAQRLRVQGESLWNILHYDPPLWVLGIRWGWSTVVASRSATGTLELPASFFQYLGGSTDLRGFGRLELSRDSQGGALSSGFLGIESRFSEIMPFHLDPFVFVDLGRLGAEPFSFDSPLYWSPGFGVRWASPVGALRSTLAYGFANNVPQHFQFYFSLGEEF
jgi:translocation and assembly module TamA